MCRRKFVGKLPDTAKYYQNFDFILLIMSKYFPGKKIHRFEFGVSNFFPQMFLHKFWNKFDQVNREYFHFSLLQNSFRCNWNWCHEIQNMKMKNSMHYYKLDCKWIEITNKLHFKQPKEFNNILNRKKQ